MLCTATGFQLSKMIDPKSGGWEINLDQISGFSPPSWAIAVPCICHQNFVEHHMDIGDTTMKFYTIIRYTWYTPED